MASLSLGLDSSTQGIKGVLVDIETRQIVWHKAIDYRADSRLKHSGVNEQYILPPTEPGQANQPVAMYFASLDAFFADMKKELAQQHINIADIAVINVSGQQHGHVLLNHDSVVMFAGLRSGDVNVKKSLAERLDDSLAAPWARIWRTSCTEPQAQFVRQVVGGKLAMIEISGSDAPLRFSAFGIRKTAQDHPDVWRKTHIIHQISSLIPAVLTGNVNVSLDYGNACGTSLMDYRLKQWSAKLLNAVADRVSDGDDLRGKLPPLASAMSLAGTIADYFVKKYGFDRRCAIGIGSGDNPQTKVLVNGSLLSLGTSFVNMVETDGKTFDNFGFANAMYDALDRPFMFGCRTNGALRWDDVRALHKLTKNDYKPAEQALQSVPPGNRGRLFFWQSENESFPVSGVFGPVRIGYDQPDLAADYAGIIESTLASVYHHSCSFMAPGDELYVAGGATESSEILRRVAAIWNRKVIPIEKGGAALGAAVSGAYALLKNQGRQPAPGQFGASFLKQRNPVLPRPDDVAAYHNPDGFLSCFQSQEYALIHPR
jgi:xylulokinase